MGARATRALSGSASADKNRADTDAVQATLSSSLREVEGSQARRLRLATEPRQRHRATTAPRCPSAHLHARRPGPARLRSRRGPGIDLITIEPTPEPAAEQTQPWPPISTQAWKPAEVSNAVQNWLKTLAICARETCQYPGRAASRHLPESTTARPLTTRLLRGASSAAAGAAADAAGVGAAADAAGATVAMEGGGRRAAFLNRDWRARSNQI